MLWKVVLVLFGAGEKRRGCKDAKRRAYGLSEVNLDSKNSDISHPHFVRIVDKVLCGRYFQVLSRDLVAISNCLTKPPTSHHSVL